jgi:hypothetical protein
VFASYWLIGRESTLRSVHTMSCVRCNNTTLTHSEHSDCWCVLTPLATCFLLVYMHSIDIPNKLSLSIYLPIYLCNCLIYLSMYGSTAVVDLALVFDFLIYIHSVELLGWVISQSQGYYLHRINAHRHLCLEWYSNSRSQLSSERR